MVKFNDREQLATDVEHGQEVSACDLYYVLSIFGSWKIVFVVIGRNFTVLF